ncbi:hypothetical protein RJ55_01055 [Drechmeria coniospora]|nr:hypothetical protein RJ55_01055 [Drechmeria coniospora]
MVYAPDGVRTHMRNFFDILEDEPPPQVRSASGTMSSSSDPRTDAEHVLDELSAVDRRQNRSSEDDSSGGSSSWIVVGKTDNQRVAAGPVPFSISTEADANDAEVARRGARARRPPIESETFEPLEDVMEESMVHADSEAVPFAGVPSAVPSHPTLRGEAGSPRRHILTTLGPDPNIQEQVERHLAGQYDYILRYPLQAISTPAHASSRDGGNPQVASESKLYGCNFVGRRPQGESASRYGDGAKSADLSYFIATPVKANTYMLFGLDGRKDKIELFEPLVPQGGGASRVSEFLGQIQEALSPCHSPTSDRSDRSDNITAASSHPVSSWPASVSVPPADNSLEEQEELDEKQKAIKASKAVPAGKQSKPTPKTPSGQASSTVLKRSSHLGQGQSATVRVTQAGKMKPVMPRPASVEVGDQRPERRINSPAQQRASSSLSRVKLAAIRPASRMSLPVKSTKPLTVPNFELPGEAVARRLREQRDAREAKQAEALRASAPPPRPKISRPLARPTFELPGEAISRRKREVREARLKAEEAEERRRREFKARPIRHSMGPTTMPRDTVTSLARQHRGSDDSGISMAGSMKGKRMSLRMPLPNSCAATHPTQGRGSATAVPDDASRTATASTGSSKGSSSTSEAGQQRLRDRKLATRDSINGRGQERERLEREAAVKASRAQAAERSRIAGREWAEKMRRKAMTSSEAV